MPSYNLVEWNKRWRLSNGVVLCKRCLAEQREVDRSSSFTHVPGCRYTEKRETPWEDLDSMRQN